MECIPTGNLRAIPDTMEAGQNMCFKRRVKAAVLSKGAEDFEDPPVLGASGSNSLLGLAAMQDESRSMWKRATVYTVSFTVKDSVKDFYVERSDYDCLEPGEEGILIYSGSRFISFKK